VTLAGREFGERRAAARARRDAAGDGEVAGEVEAVAQGAVRRAVRGPLAERGPPLWTERGGQPRPRVRHLAGPLVQQRRPRDGEQPRIEPGRHRRTGDERLRQVGELLAQPFPRGVDVVHGAIRSVIRSVIRS
jgi:hypothetical protein